MTKKSHPFAVLGTCVLAALVGCGSDGNGVPADTEARRAAADITPSAGQTARGTAVFTEENGMVQLDLALNDLTPGEHAVHIHEMPDCSMDGMAAMGHWNPTGEDHGKWGTPPFHRGDIGNVTADAMGKASFSLRTELWTVGDGAPMTDVVGHAFMVHADPDDFMSQPAGNAGARISCGLIVRDE